MYAMLAFPYLTLLALVQFLSLHCLQAQPEHFEYGLLWRCCIPRGKQSRSCYGHSIPS